MALCLKKVLEEDNSFSYIDGLVRLYLPICNLDPKFCKSMEDGDTYQLVQLDLSNFNPSTYQLLMNLFSSMLEYLVHQS